MARPERNNVDYFPFICEDGNKMFYIEETYGNDGFATFVKILRELAKTNYHYLDLSKPSTIMFLSAKCKVSKEVLICIISDLVDLGKFNEALWKENKIVWCQDFVDSIQDAYFKRKNKCITLEGLLLLLQSLGVRKPSKSKPKGVINTQSIVEDSKLEETKKDFKEEIEFFDFSQNDDFNKILEKEEKEKSCAKKENEMIAVKFNPDDSKHKQFASSSVESQEWVDSIFMRNKFHEKGFSHKELKQFIDDFNLKLISEGEIKHNKRDWQSHFSRNLPFEIQKLEKQKQDAGKEQPIVGRATASVIKSNLTGWEFPE